MGLLENNSRYLQMSFDELKSLSDDKLFYAVMIRTEHQVDSFDEWKDGVNSLNPYQKVFYSVNWLETEVNNGGLCQFFANSSRMVAPLISEYMAIIGAHEHKKLYDEFVEANEIDLNDLSSFDSDTLEEFEKLYDIYPFDDYDDVFYEMEPLETYLTKYARENLTNF